MEQAAEPAPWKKEKSHSKNQFRKELRSNSLGAGCRACSMEKRKKPQQKPIRKELRSNSLGAGCRACSVDRHLQFLGLY
jgi:hypothetical protein